jgi:beta-phosphoglucomutase-like phosphatase (HAD superfamily)
MPRAVIFDIDGMLLDSVDLHARAWVDAFAAFGKFVAFGNVRGQIGKGGDQLLPVILSAEEIDGFGKDLETWRGNHFKRAYLPSVRPFPPTSRL